MKQYILKLDLKFVKSFIILLILLFGLNFGLIVDATSGELNHEIPTVKINVTSESIIYEGDIVDCHITGNPTFVYWSINNLSKHTTFYGDDPAIFDPEPTPLDTDYITLTVYAENAFGNSSDSVQVIVKRIYFGDIHWHSTFSDGKYPLSTLYKNTKEDNYLDFVGSTDHAELRFLKQKIFYPIIWQMNKILVNSQYIPGDFTTFLAYEYSGTKLDIGNLRFPLGDTSHINFYYKDIYPYALRYSSDTKRIYDTIFRAMNKEWNAGHYNIGFFHHPLARNIRVTNISGTNKIVFGFYVNWTRLIKKFDDIKFRDNALKIIRGVETYSRWGTSIGKYSDIPVHWPYYPRVIYDSPDGWVENALWEWSESSYTKGHPFVLQAGSDSHFTNRAGSAEIPKEKVKTYNPSGIIAVFSIHNTRSEIWEAINNCDIYGSQLLKIRANVRFDGQMALGQWINCSSPLKINITAMSTYPGLDSSSKNMCPHNYSQEELDYPIQDIWLLKKDRERGRPWCKIIGHAEPNKNLAVVTFQDEDVQPNDFYWVAIRQKGQELKPGQNEYMAFIGPVFVNNVE